MRRFTSILAALSVLSILAAPIVVADTASASSPVTVTIQPGQALFLEFDSVWQTKLSYDVEVISGPNIDVIVTDERGYESYFNPFSTLWYYPEASYLNTRSASVTTNVQGGQYYLIIDNSMAGRATPDGQPVTVRYSLETSPGPLPILLATIIAAVAIILIIYAIRYAIRRSKRRDEIPPFPAPAPARLCSKCNSPLKSWYNACPRCGDVIRPPEGSS
ncbi:MAG TPA: hypothetical protein GXZ80_08215 [Euryarchaeota archaeon]|jgi:hypothetical protein|nr:hypothetical protein [Euryarchaeota archaeon]